MRIRSPGRARMCVPLALATLASVPLLGLGCGSSRPAQHPVTGIVTWRGKALETGAVLFVPEEGPAATSTIDKSGRYHLNAISGDHRVAVVALPVPPEGANEMTYTAAPIIPARFGRVETSGLRVNVQPQKDNSIDIALR